MRPRTEALLAAGALVALAVLASVAGRSRAPEPTLQAGEPPSTFLSGPGGAKGLLAALQRLGVESQRFRERPKELSRFAGRPHQLLAILDPDVGISAPDAIIIARFAHAADLLLAGPGTERVMNCFGYRIERHYLDSARVEGLGARAPLVSGALASTGEVTHVDSSRATDVGRLSCKVPTYRSVTTVLRSSHGAAVVRLEGDSGHQVLLVADASLLANHALRDTDAGPFVLGLIDGHYDHVLFDEYHHGFRDSGSLAQATLDWSLKSPWGWAAWQIAAAGVLALLFGAVRFGPAITGIVRTRRSALEHVRALAAALSAGRGHDEAIAALVRGLRRRLAPPALRARGDWRAWLAERERRATSSAERESVNTLISLTQPGQPSTSVLQAANAVEDLWQNLQQ